MTIGAEASWMKLLPSMPTLGSRMLSADIFFWTVSVRQGGGLGAGAAPDGARDAGRLLSRPGCCSLTDLVTASRRHRAPGQSTAPPRSAGEGNRVDQRVSNRSPLGPAPTR